MPTDTNLDKLIINYLTKEQYKALTDINENQLYLTPEIKEKSRINKITLDHDNYMAYLTLDAFELTDEQLALAKESDFLNVYVDWGQSNNNKITYAGTWQVQHFANADSETDQIRFYTINADSGKIVICSSIGDKNYPNAFSTNDIKGDATALISVNPSGQGFWICGVNRSTGESKVYDFYAPTTINDTATAKILSSKDGAMEWVDLPTQKQFFKHAIQIPINEGAVSILITNSTNTAITDVTAINTALGSVTQYPCSGAFKNGDIVCMAVSYNATTSKVKVFNGTALEEIALATAGTITLGTITDEIVEIQ